MCPTVPLILQKPFSIWTRVILPRIGKRFPKMRSLLVSAGFSSRLLHASRICKLLREVGFSRVRSFDYSGGIATAFIARKN
jgi:ubiquinone/menaquinone biosynthesis C-methylase UbiE